MNNDNENGNLKLDDVITSHLSDWIVENDNLIGYFEDLETFNQIILKMKELGYTFSVRDSDVRHKRMKISGDGSADEVWNSGKGNGVFYHLKAMSIRFFGLPFTVEKTTNYQCAYGCKYYKSKAEHKSKTDDIGPTLPVKKRRSVISKKIGCLAKMTLKKITVYPDYELDSLKDWRKKKKLINNLRINLMVGESEVKKSCRYYLAISKQSCHNHPPIVNYEVPKPKNHSNYTSGKIKIEEVDLDKASWVTLYPASKGDIEVATVATKAIAVQDATFFNSLVKFPANTIAYTSEIKPVSIQVQVDALEGESKAGQDESKTYQLETIQYPSAQDLQTLFKDKLKKLYHLSENCANVSLLMRLLSDLDQADAALVADLGYDISL